MEIQTRNIDCSMQDNRLIIEITVNNHARTIDEITEFKDWLGQTNKNLSVKIEKEFPKRSLTANAYSWVLIGKIAEVTRQSQDEVYIEMLKRYGQREQELVSVISEAVEMLERATKNHCCVVGTSELNGKEFTHLAILIGSSKFNSRQMSIYIDGIKSECELLGIETKSQKEIQSMLEKIK